jgi:hypothetical protein
MELSCKKPVKSWRVRSYLSSQASFPRNTKRDRGRGSPGTIPRSSDPPGGLVNAYVRLAYVRLTARGPVAPAGAE